MIIAVLATLRTIIWCKKVRRSKSVPISAGLVNNEVTEPTDDDTEVTEVNKTPAVI